MDNQLSHNWMKILFFPSELSWHLCWTSTGYKYNYLLLDFQFYTIDLKWSKIYILMLVSHTFHYCSLISYWHCSFWNWEVWVLFWDYFGYSESLEFLNQFINNLINLFGHDIPFVESLFPNQGLNPVLSNESAQSQPRNHQLISFKWILKSACQFCKDSWNFRRDCVESVDQLGEYKEN